MCIGDWRLGQLISTEVRSISLSVGASDTIPADLTRVGLSLNMAQNGASNAVRLLTTQGEFHRLQFDQASLHLTLDRHGQLVQRSITLSNFGLGTMVTGVVLYTLPREYLMTALDQWRTEYGMALSR